MKRSIHNSLFIILERKGFTLIEITVGMGITAIIFFMIGVLGNQFSAIATFVNQKLQNEQSAESAIQTMVREIRSAGQSSVGGFAIESAAPSSFVFFSDIDSDGLMERVRYFLATSTAATSTIQKGVTKPAGNPLTYTTSTEIVRPVLADSVSTSTIFTYFDANYTGTENPLSSPIDLSKIRIVKIEVLVDVDPAKNPGADYFTNSVAIRSLRSN